MFHDLRVFTLFFISLLALTVHSLPFSHEIAHQPIAKRTDSSLSRKLHARIEKRQYDDHDPAHPLLTERTESPGGLFGDNGIPDLADLDQTSLPDCGLISVLGALVALNPRYITDLIQYSGNPSTTRAALFKLHEPGSLKEDYQTIFKDHLPEARSDAFEGWWVGGIEEAVRQSGRDISILPNDALEMITGQKAKYRWLETGQVPHSDAMSKDDVWNLLIDHAEHTPIILQSWTPVANQPWTIPKTLQKQHAFWVVSAKVDGVRSITLWNPHGENEVHDFDEIWADCYALYSFADLTN